MWSVQLHGNTENLPDNEARDEEMTLAHHLRELVVGLVPRGHTGVAATLHGDHVGAVNLTDPAQPPAGTPVPGEGVVADGTPLPAPTEPPPTFPVGE